jgi:hypothetical protein
MNKKILSVFCLLLTQGPLFAQFNSSDYGKSFDCTIIFKSGETKKLYVKYSHPGVLMGPKNLLETNTEGNLDKNLIETFYMNNQCWVERSTPVGRQWVILNRQGVIEHVTYITSAVTTSNVNTTPVTGDLIIKNGQWETNTSLVMGYKKKMSSFISDYPELAVKVTNGEKGYGFINYLNVVDEYNAWFEKNNPDQIKYYPWFAQGKKNAPASLSDVANALKQSKDSVANAKKEFAASRPATVAPEIASMKPNVTPKKETFSAKVKRYEADGHKIAVVMQDQKTRLFIGSTGLGAGGLVTKEPKMVCFEGAAEAEFIQPEILEETVAELNKAYSTNIFVAVQQNKIPLKQVKNLPVDDWWSTCYKTVVFLSHIRQFSCSSDMLNEGDFEGSGSLGLYANVFEYTDNEGKKDTDILKRLYNLGYGSSDSFKYKKTDCPVNFEILEARIDWAKVKQQYVKKKQEQFAKLVDKWG